jgi:VWFA-related protein
MKQARSRVPLVFIITLFFLSIPRFALSSPQQEHEPIKHEVAVTRMLIPVFAYDAKGNPIDDLKKEDLQLYVSGKKVDISSFNQVRFAYDKEIGKTVKVKQAAPAEQERIIFLVVDSMFNSFYGLKNARRIIKKLLDSDSFDSQFVIMENSLFGGLKLIGGPEADKKKLNKFLKKISRIPEQNAIRDKDDITSNSPFERSYAGRNLRKVTDDIERKHAKEKVKFFCDFLAQLKYSLEAIDQPKMVFLISEGLPEILFFEANPHLKGHINYDTSPIMNIKRLVKEINDGGTLLYAIYPGRVKVIQDQISSSSAGKGSMDTGEYDYGLDDVNIPIVRDSGIESLKAISVGSGGRLFDGNTEQIVKEIQRMTSAYYELTFSPPTRSGETMRIRIKCKRDGVKIDTLARAVRGKDYAAMETVRKKVFALNVVLERSWALSMAEVHKADFQWLDQEKRIIEVMLPDNLKGREVDIFQVRFDKNLENPNVSMKHKKVNDTEVIQLEEYGQQHSLYFLIIEPGSTVCVYNIIDAPGPHAG